MKMKGLLDHIKWSLFNIFKLATLVAVYFLINVVKIYNKLSR